MKRSSETIVCIIPSSLQKKSLPFLARALASLQTDEFNVVTIIVSTSPHAAKPLNSRYVSVTLRAPKTAGFSEMNSLAIEYALEHLNPDYVLLLNDDAELFPNFFVHLKKNCTEQPVGIIAPLICNGTAEQIDSFGIEYFRSGYAKNASSSQIHTQLATAACLFISRSALQQMKDSYGYFFNPLLYYYFEDVEFSIRARMCGVQIQKSSALRVLHAGSATSVKGSRFVMYQTYRNILWVLILCWPSSLLLRHSTSILLVQLWMFAYSTRTFGWRLYAQVLTDTVRSFPYLLKFRSKNMSAYKKSIPFSTLLSPLTFRTYHGIKIKVS